MTKIYSFLCSMLGSLPSVAFTPMSPGTQYPTVIEEAGGGNVSPRQGLLEVLSGLKHLVATPSGLSWSQASGDSLPVLVSSAGPHSNDNSYPLLVHFLRPGPVSIS